MSTTPTLKVYLRSSATLPTRGSKDAAGLDLYTDFGDPDNDYVVVEAGKRVTFNTGVFVAIPEGHYGRVAPRSGLANNYGLDVLAGVIDSDYRGELKVIVLNTGKIPLTVRHGDKIAQLILEKITIPHLEEVGFLSDLKETERGENGFGSTGR